MLVKMPSNETQDWDKYKLSYCQLKMFSVCQNPPAYPVSTGLWQFSLNPALPSFLTEEKIPYCLLFCVPCVWQGKHCQGKQMKEHVWGLARQLGAQNRKEQARRKMSLVAERLLLSWASARSAWGTFSLLREMDLKCFKPKSLCKDHTDRQENWVFAVCSVLNYKKNRNGWAKPALTKICCSAVDTWSPWESGGHQDSVSSHCFSPLIKRYSTDTNGYTESMFLLPIFHILSIRHLMHHFFYFAGCKLLCQRLVTWGNVLGKRCQKKSVASRLYSLKIILANKYILLQW